MDTVFGIILVIIFLLIVMGPFLQRVLGPWLQRWMMGKFEDRMRRMAGMPTRKEERKANRRARTREKEGAERFRQAAGGSRKRASSAADALREYAEDVEYVEVKSYSQEVEINQDPETGRTTVVMEEQVEDAVFEEIKSARQ